MPIYAYKCSSCGMSKDILRKISDPALTLCPECGREALEKQVTSAGFQLKGSGWYVTDFREGNKATSVPPASSDKTTEAVAPAVSKDTTSAPAAASTTTPAATSPAASPASSTASSTTTSGAST